jgi:Na+-translocating ferredoxin:NAD+ oxidoreductase RNF subunit RnfB
MTAECDWEADNFSLLFPSSSCHATGNIGCSALAEAQIVF